MTRLDLEVLQITSGFGGADCALGLAATAILDRAETTEGDVMEGLLLACRVIDALRGELREAAKAPRPVLVDEYRLDADGQMTPGILAELEVGR